MAIYAGLDISDKSTHLCLVERGVAVTCICARQANGVLSTRANKSDPHDAEPRLHLL